MVDLKFHKNSKFLGHVWSRKILYNRKFSKQEVFSFIILTQKLMLSQNRTFNVTDYLPIFFTVTPIKAVHAFI